MIIVTKKEYDDLIREVGHEALGMHTVTQTDPNDHKFQRQLWQRRQYEEQSVAEEEMRKVKLDALKKRRDARNYRQQNKNVVTTTTTTTTTTTNTTTGAAAAAAAAATSQHEKPKKKEDDRWVVCGIGGED